MDTLALELDRIRTQLRGMRGDKEKDKKKQKEKGKHRKHDKKSKSSRGRRDSSSSGSSSRSRGHKKSGARSRHKKKKKRHGSSSSGSSSSSGTTDSEEGRMIKWRAKGRSRDVDPAELRNLETRKFKARGELLSFAAQHPGALSGFFLGLVHQKLSHGLVRRTGDLRKVSCAQWATQYTGLTEVRDLREVQTLAAVMDLINMADLETAMDTLDHRIVAIQSRSARTARGRRRRLSS